MRGGKNFSLYRALERWDQYSKDHPRYIVQSIGSPDKVTSGLLLNHFQAQKRTHGRCRRVQGIKAGSPSNSALEIFSKHACALTDCALECNVLSRNQRCPHHVNVDDHDQQPATSVIAKFQKGLRKSWCNWTARSEVTYNPPGACAVGAQWA